MSTAHQSRCREHSRASLTIHHSEAAPPPGVQSGYVGPVFLPGTGRHVWWTGRVQIGLLHQTNDFPPVDDDAQRPQAEPLAA